ncbi:hypothetical protein CR513_24245, partial [Mucuna pruriens]
MVNNFHLGTGRVRRKLPPIIFIDQNFVGVDPEQNDLMVIIVAIANFTIKKILIDQGSSMNILYMSTFKQLRIPKFDIKPYHEQLIGFSDERVDTRGYVDLLTTFDDQNAMRTISIRYLVVNTETSYNTLIGRPTLNALAAIVSTPHLVVTIKTSEKKEKDSSLKKKKKKARVSMFQRELETWGAYVLGEQSHFRHRRELGPPFNK